MSRHTPTPAQQDIAGPMPDQRTPGNSGQTGSLTGRRLGDYHLGVLLGTGGMADVYRAYDFTLMRDVAVKVLSLSLARDPDYIDRFRAEARRVAALSHPHLVPVYHAGEEHVDGQRLLYLVMPLLHESLDDVLEREGKLAPTTAVRLVLQIADGLHAAHRYGLVHRDVKPGNILLDSEGQALLADFGLAREVMHGSRAASRQPWGTPEYMAPEHLRGDAVDQRADIYSLGIVLYELLTGKRPFDGQTAYDIAARALTTPPEPPSTHEPAIPAALDHIVLTALSREPGDRYPSMNEFALALRHAISSQPGKEASFTAAMPIALPDRFWSPPQSMVRASKRRSLRRLLAFFLAAVLLATGVAGTVLTLQHQRGGDSHQTTSTHAGGLIAQASPTGQDGLGSSQTPQPTAGGTSTPHARPTPTATATLSITPTPLVLTPISTNPKKCTATQTITNNTTTTVGWAWQKPPVAGFQFQIDGRPSVAWPTATTSTPPGGQDTLVVTSDCKPQPISYAVLVKDSLGGQYTFILTLE